MKIKFLKTVTLDVIHNDQHCEKTFKLNDTLDVSELIPISKMFSNLILSSEDTLLDIRNDHFTKVD